MHLNILQDVYGLTFEGSPDTDLVIGVDFRLTTNPQVAVALFDRFFASPFGKAHAEASRKCAAHLCVLNKYPQPSLTHDQAMAITLISMDHALLFLEALWLVRDNSGNLSAAFVASADDDGHVHFIFQPHSIINFTSDCLCTETHFTRKELDAAVDYFARMLDLMPRGVQKRDQPRPTGMLFASRLGRALYVTQAARSTSDLGIKVAFYCIAFESLFSTDSAGVGHRVAERMANFIGNDGPDKRSIFRDAHDLYGSRSAVVHGNTIKASKIPELLELTKRGDEYLRRCLRKMIDDRELTTLFSRNDRDELGAYFLRTLFPDRQ